MGAYGIMKGLEWGLAADLLPYTFVGFDPASATTANAHDKRPSTRDARLEARQRRRAHLAALRSKQAASDGPIDILRATAHLLVSMRGQGYEFCGTTTAPFARDNGAFFRRVVAEIAWAHPLLVLCSAALLEPPTSRDVALHAVLPSALGAVAPEHVHALGEALTGLAMGVAVFAALTLGYSVSTLGAFLGTLALRRAPLVPAALRPPEWDASEYPPLFNLADRPQSVAKFWSHQWHSFFSSAFPSLSLSLPSPPSARCLTREHATQDRSASSPSSRRSASSRPSSAKLPLGPPASSPSLRSRHGCTSSVRPSLLSLSLSFSLSLSLHVLTPRPRAQASPRPSRPSLLPPRRSRSSPSGAGPSTSSRRASASCSRASLRRSLGAGCEDGRARRGRPRSSCAREGGSTRLGASSLSRLSRSPHLSRLDLTLAPLARTQGHAGPRARGAARQVLGLAAVRRPDGVPPAAARVDERLPEQLRARACGMSGMATIV